MIITCFFHTSLILVGYKEGIIQMCCHLPFAPKVLLQFLIFKNMSPTIFIVYYTWVWIPIMQLIGLNLSTLFNQLTYGTEWTFDKCWFPLPLPILLDKLEKNHLFHYIEELMYVHIEQHSKYFKRYIRKRKCSLYSWFPVP